jgi:arginyl-tRNA--protein-N-Asp/Glu arginylyltransferase
MTIQQEFYEAQASLVYCNFQPDLERVLDELSILENLNIAEDLSEAIEIVLTEIEEREN